VPWRDVALVLAVLEFSDLTIAYGGREEEIIALQGCTFRVAPGEIIALVGESGSGKTTALKTALGEFGSNGRRVSGTVLLDGEDILSLDSARLMQLRRSRLGYVPQNAGSSLDPTKRIGQHLKEAIDSRLDDAGMGERILGLLERVHLPPRVAHRWPHQLSGGQQQRVTLAIALAQRPEVLLLDEPTTGLDARVQAEILDLIRELAEQGLAVLYVTHDLAAAASVSTRMAILYAAELLEEGTFEGISDRPAHPYTAALLAARPSARMRCRVHGIPGTMLAPAQRREKCVFSNRCEFATAPCLTQRPDLVRQDARVVRCLHANELTLPGIRQSAQQLAADQVPAGNREVLSVQNLWVRYFRAQSRTEWAVQDVSLNVNDGETFGLVGESGSGKTSVARVVAGLVLPIEGEVLLDGKVLPANAKKRTIRDLRRIQYVFQNSSLALNPRQTIAEILDRPLKAFFDLSRGERHKRILELMDLVRLPPRLLSAGPGTLSGGEQQRVAIARALAAEPEIVICDEIVSALDVSVQGAIVELLGQLQSQMGLSYLFVSHDLAVVRSIAHRIGVMYKGRLVESGPSERIFQDPEHEYTRILLAHTPDNLLLAQDIVAAR
jgi:peptide/nickel transport system ATP-binding protein